MSVQDPGTLTVDCDECGDVEMEMDTTSYAGSPNSFGVDDDTLSENGWASEGDNTYCPKCAKMLGLLD